MFDHGAVVVEGRGGTRQRLMDNEPTRRRSAERSFPREQLGINSRPYEQLSAEATNPG